MTIYPTQAPGGMSFTEACGRRLGILNESQFQDIKHTRVRDSKCDALCNQGQGYLPRIINYKVLSSTLNGSVTNTFPTVSR